MISVFATVASAVLEPRTAGSATTDLAGVLEGAALRASHCTPKKGGDDPRAKRCGPGYKFSFRYWST